MCMFDLRTRCYIDHGISTLYKMLFDADNADMKQFTQELIDTAQKVRHVVEVIEEGFTSVAKTLLHLPVLHGSLKDEKRQCSGKVTKAKRNAHTFLEHVYRFYGDADLDNDTAQSIRESQKRGDNSGILKYAEQLKTNWEQCRESYKDFIEVYAEAKVTCAKIAKACGIKRDASKERQVLPSKGMIAGTAELVAIASITLGEGTIAVTSTDAVAMVTGVLSLNTLAEAVKDAELEGIFGSICDNMDEVCEDLSHVSIGMDSINKKLNVTEGDLTAALSHVSGDHAFEDFCKMFEKLISGIESSYETFH